MAQTTEITPDELVDRVGRAPGNIAVATLLELRSAYNRGRITPGVLEDIKSKLELEHRVGVIAPDALETYQEQEAYIFKLDSPVGALLGAAQRPSEAGLRRLREVVKPAGEAVEADANLSTVKAALEDATVALRDYLGENGRS